MSEALINRSPPTGVTGGARSLTRSKAWLLALWLFLSYGTVFSQQKPSPIVAVGNDGRLEYHPDKLGNRLPDFSHCGYAGGEREIPLAPVRVVVESKAGDSTRRIQKAIDYVAAREPDARGVRGAVLLLKGRHEVGGTLRLNASGVVLRGEGMGDDGTVLLATGQDRRTLIRIAGLPRPNRGPVNSIPVLDAYVPVGTRSFRVPATAALKAGDTIEILRPSVQPWIEELGMNQLGGGVDWRLTWKAGSRDLRWDRVVQTNAGGWITVDAPLTTALDAKYGGGHVSRYDWPQRLREVGVENLRCESAFDTNRPKDEDHAWIAVTVQHAENVWVRQVAGFHFAGSLVTILPESKWVTVEDCLSLAPVSEEGGYRRHTFFTQGELTLFMNCWSEQGRHDFSAGQCAAGPNAFVHCEASEALSDSGPIESWASGILYDNVRIDGRGLTLGNRGPAPHGAGWAAANCVLWQCSAARIICDNPPTAQNWAFGCWGEFDGGGIWRQSNEFVSPASLYQAQLTDRLGRDAAKRLHFLKRDTTETTNPSAERANDFATLATKPANGLKEHIRHASGRVRIDSARRQGESIDEIAKVASGGNSSSQGASSKGTAAGLKLTNGWLTIGERLLIGSLTNVGWWRGNLRPEDASAAEPAVTRFVPGRNGWGYTDDLEALAEMLAQRGVGALEHHHGLWYDRRRDDHQRIRRMDGDVWPPFFEQPFARSGQGTAWDGLSRYDLTRYNPWYWSRLKQVATVCQAQGLVLFHQNYFQHNVLEAGAHWADFPWRSANNINDTGFPEPPPYAGEKRIFMAAQFYDVNHPGRGRLHRAYIRQCLENFRDAPNVIQFTSAEFTGPQAFVEFWLDTIAEWEQETGLNPLVALSCSRRIQDEVLRNPQRARLADVIDLRYWWLTDQGAFEPEGGANLAPRQFERQWKGGRPEDRHLARMAADYRKAHSEKAVISAFAKAGWAFLCAGGSLPRLPQTTDGSLLSAIPRMQPWAEGSTTNRWVLRETGRQYLVYCGRGSPKELDLSGEQGGFAARQVDLKSGQLGRETKTFASGKQVTLGEEQNEAVIWLTRQP